MQEAEISHVAAPKVMDNSVSVEKGSSSFLFHWTRLKTQQKHEGGMTPSHESQAQTIKNLQFNFLHSESPAGDTALGSSSSYQE